MSCLTSKIYIWFHYIFETKVLYLSHLILLMRLIFMQHWYFFLYNLSFAFIFHFAHSWQSRTNSMNALSIQFAFIYNTVWFVRRVHLSLSIMNFKQFFATRLCQQTHEEPASTNFRTCNITFMYDSRWFWKWKKEKRLKKVEYYK